MDQNVQNNLDTDVSSLDQLAARISTLRQTESPTSVKINTPGSSAGLSTINASNAQDFDNFLNGLNNQAYDPLKFNRVSNSAFKPLLRYRLNPEYDSQGYNPFADNEAVYNTNTTWVSDMGRASKLIIPAIGDFAWETMTNYDLTDWSSDIEGAKEYSSKMDLMMSSRGGAGGFAVNLYAQLAPTLGVLTGIGVEQIVAKGLEYGAARVPGLQGLLPVAQGLEANSARQLFKLPKLVSSFGKAKDSFNAFRTLDTAAKIRSIYTGVGKGGMSLIKGINPLSNTFKAYQNIRSGAAGVALAGDMAKLYKTAGGLHRDIQNYRVVLNEANLEGGLAINEHIKSKREEYIKTHGYEPMGDDAYAIYEEAQAIGNATQMINMGIIHLTNSFGFNRLVDKAISPRAAAAKTFAEKFNAYIVETGAKGAGKASYKLLENNFKKWGSKAYYKHMLTSAPSGLLSYFGNNLMEGTQEILQESIVNGVTHYYDNMYSDPIKFHKATMGESIKYGLGSQLDAKGAEVFLSGFLTGGAANMVTTPMLSVFTKANKIIDPEGYKKALELSNEQKNRILTSANYVADNRQEFFNMLDKRAGEQLNYARSGEIAQALGDEKTARDIKDGATFSHVYNLYKAGRIDIIKDQLNGLLELEDNELADSLNETVQGSYGIANLRDRVKTTMKRVDNIQKTVDKINETYENPYQPWEINKKVNPDKFNEEYARWDAYEDAKYFAAFATDSYSRAVERMYSITNDMSSSPIFQNTAGMGVGRMFSVNQLQDDASNLRTQAKIYRENNESTKADELEERANKYDNLAKNSNLYSKFLQFVGKSETLSAEEAKDLDKVKQKLSEQGVEVEDLTLDNVDDIEKLLKDSFNEYVKDLAKDNPSSLLDSNLDQVFAPYRDWHKLGDDTTVMSKWVNHLTDPAGFNRVQDTIKSAKDEVYANRKRILKEQKDRYMKGLIKDKLLKDLYAAGIMVSKEDEDAFLNEKRYPNLIDANTMEPIKSNDPRIANIIDIFDQYEELNDVLVNDKPIYDASTETILSNSLTDAAGRTKSAKDTRTYSDFVEALGIDNTKDEQEIEISTLYNYILDSKFSTPAEKKLVQRIKDKYKKAKITISKNHNAPISYDETNGLIIDLRYASDDYKAGKIRSEFLMLKGIMTAMTFNFLESDSKFETEVEEMRNAIKDAVSKNSDLLAEYNGRVPRALESNKDFINDIMTNSLFQGVASRIKSTRETKKSVYADFIKSIKQFIGKLLGIKTTRSSILDQAVNLVGSKVQDTDYTKPFKKEKPKAEKKADEAAEEGVEELTEEDAINAINQAVSIKDMPQSLVDILDAEFKKVISLSDAPYTKAGFSKFVATSPKAASLIEKWKKSEKARLKKEAEESTKKKETKKKKVEKVDDDEEPIELTDEDKEALYELGYSRSDINSMGELAAEVLGEKMARDTNPMFAAAEGDFTEADKKVADLRKKVLEQNLQLTADQKQYEPKNKKKAKEEGKPLLYRRISELLGKDSDNINPVSAERGNVTDEIYRDFMGGRINSIPELRVALEKASAKKGLFKYNDDFVVDLYDTMQFIRDYLTNAGFKIVSDFPTLSGDIGGPIAGTIDFLIYDEEGNISFIDLKTSTANLRKKYANPEKDQYQYKVGHTIQQNGYRELFKQQTGESVDNLLILPLQIFTNRAGVHTGIKLEGAENDKGDMTYTLPISTTRDIYQLTGIGKRAVTPKDVISDEIYNNFVDNDVVPKEVLESIAEKIVNNKPRSEYENAIFNGKTSEINEIIRQKYPAPSTTTTEKTAEQTIAGLRAQEQVELRNAIPNIESYKDAEGNLDKSKLSPLELQMYNQIYAKYDKLISPSIADAEAKIEERRKESLYILTQEDLDRGEDVGIRKNEDGTFEGEVWDYNNVLFESYKGTLKEVQEKINAKYDAEIAKLKGKPATTTKTPKTKTEKKAATKEKIEKTKVEKKTKSPAPKKSTAKTKEELTKERDDLIKPLEDEKAELGRILETEQSKRLVRDTVNNEITPEEMTALQEELGTSEEGVKAQVVSEVVNQMNDKKPARAKTLLQKVAKRIKRILLNVMIGTMLFNSMSFTYNPKAKVLTYQTVNVENLESFDSALLDQEATNKLDNLNIITKSFEDSNESYLIVDKPNALAHLFQGDSLIDTFEVGTGRKAGDAQTKTVIKNGKVLWEQGNQQTGAGIYTVGGIGQYKSSPSYTLRNEEGIEVPTVLHETLDNRKKLFADNDASNNRMSFGCVNFKAESLNKLASYTNFNAGSKVFVLPDDSTNKFQIIDGDLRFISQDTNVNRTIKGYTAQPIAIKAGKESKIVNDFVNAIADNKAELMRLYPTISNTDYNQIATIAYGIMGQESSFGTFGGIRGQYGKSRDDAQVMMGYGVPSVGVTQIRFTSVNSKIKDAFGITKQEDIKDNVDKAAIATMGVLLDVYENEIPANLKQDFKSLLPLAYSNRTEFAKAIKGDTTTYDNQYVRNVNNYSEDVEVYQGVASETTKEEKSEKAPIQTSAVGLIGLASLYRRRQESGESLSDVDLQGIQDQINDINKEISRIKTEYNSKIRGALSESRKKAEDITKETEKEPTFVSKGDVIKMADGSIVQVTKVSKNKIEVVPYMQQDGDTMIINQEDMDQGKAIVVKPGQKVEAQEVTPEDTEMLTESVSSANTIANDKENQLAIANRAESQTSAERANSFKDKLKNRCISNG